jgi:predicted nucleic acid-binding protein
VILADSSACIEFLRATGSAANLRMRSAIAGREVASTGPTLMEVVAGARGELDLRRIRRMFASFTLLPADDPNDYLLAATIYRSCRAGGETIWRMIDCLVAAVAIRSGVQLLHHDRDFDAIARHTPLRLA